MTDSSLIQLGARAKEAARTLRILTADDKNSALFSMAAALEESLVEILHANGLDLDAARDRGMGKAMLDRLALSEARIKDMADGMRQVAGLPDPVGIILEKTRRPNGLYIEKISVPIGVVGIIYEARPNVTADAAALCIKAGNAAMLRGGSEAINSNIAVTGAMRGGLERAGVPADAVILVEDTSRETAGEMMRLNGYIDVLIPRGGAGLIETVIKNSTVPVIETGVGNCHVYVDRDADIDMAVNITVNAKVSRPSVCNAAETLLVHRDIAGAGLPRLAAALIEKGVTLRCGEKAYEYLTGFKIERAADEDWYKEYNDYIITVGVVESIEEAVNHVSSFGTGHSDCIITKNNASAKYFVSHVDSAAVYVNSSTRFTDGGEFGFGAEIGISTQKLHARGPMGLRELTSYKYAVYGDGQIR